MPVARYGPPDDPNNPDNQPTAYINYGDYGQPPPGEPLPWYRKPVALVAFSISCRTPNTRLFHQAWHVCGEVGFAPYALPGSAFLQLVDAIDPLPAAAIEGKAVGATGRYMSARNRFNAA